MELQLIVSHLLKLSSAWNPFSVGKKKQKTKNQANKQKTQTEEKLIKVVCMSEHWPEVVQVCSAPGVTAEGKQELSGRAGAE